MTNNIRTKSEIIENIISYFEDNEDIFNSCIEELDSYNGYLGDDRYYEMYMLDDFYTGVKASELLERAFYGCDDDSWHTDAHGEKIYGAFNPNREYFYYNGYGNLVSADYKDYSAHLDSWVVESMLDNRYYIDTINDTEELQELFFELETLLECANN
jgi:hypothetical protein